MTILDAVRNREDKITIEQVPTRYIVFERRQHCTCCNSDHTWSELYAYSPIPAKLGFGKMVSNLKAILWPKYRLPVDQRAATKTERIPFCHACHDPSLEHAFELLDPPQPREELQRIMKLVERTATSELAKPKAGTKSKATLSDLEDLLK